MYISVLQVYIFSGSICQLRKLLVSLDISFSGDLCFSFVSHFLILVNTIE
jgi:hypothetical protein